MQINKTQYEIMPSESISRIEGRINEVFTMAEICKWSASGCLGMRQAISQQSVMKSGNLRWNSAMSTKGNCIVRTKTLKGKAQKNSMIETKGIFWWIA